MSTARRREQPFDSPTDDVSFSLAELELAADFVHRIMLPTPQLAWPLLEQRFGCKVFVKHENHTPIGAFKIRGGLVYMEALSRSGRASGGVITATRGNHGQSIALAGSRVGLPVTVVVPRGNSQEKNKAMAALGAKLIEFGSDFDEAKHEALRLSKADGLHRIPSFHVDLVKGVATYALELLRAAENLDVVYVPIGMGSGICGMILTRDLLGLKTEIVGVVADNAPTIALSFSAGRPVATTSARTFADGMACREPNEQALSVILRGAARIVRVSESDIAAAIRFYYQDTHNIAEGAGAAALAALQLESAAMTGKRVGVILSGGNIDMSSLLDVLSGRLPPVEARAVEASATPPS